MTKIMRRSIWTDFRKIAVLTKNILNGMDGNGGAVSVDEKETMFDAKCFPDTNPRLNVINGLRTGEVEQSFFFAFPMDQYDPRAQINIFQAAASPMRMPVEQSKSSRATSLVV